MPFVALGLVASLILGAFAMGVVILSTRGRRRAPLGRGRAERAIQYGAGILSGLLLLLTLMVLRPEVTPASQDAALLGILLAMPVSSAATWLAGELLAGPTKESWLPLLFAILAAHAGFIGPMVVLMWMDAHVLSAWGNRASALALSAALLASFVLGGFASAWAYRRSRKEVVVAYQHEKRPVAHRADERVGPAAETS